MNEYLIQLAIAFAVVLLSKKFPNLFPAGPNQPTPGPLPVLPSLPSIPQLPGNPILNAVANAPQIPGTMVDDIARLYRELLAGA